MDVNEHETLPNITLRHIKCFIAVLYFTGTVGSVLVVVFPLSALRRKSKDWLAQNQ